MAFPPGSVVFVMSVSSSRGWSRRTTPSAPRTGSPMFGGSSDVCRISRGPDALRFAAPDALRFAAPDGGAPYVWRECGCMPNLAGLLAKGAMLAWAERVREA